MKFRVGDKIELIDNIGMNAPIGSTAIVTGYWDYGITIRWLNKGTSGQVDGSYCSSHFKLIPINCQLLFSFMEE